jgi:hypothetical protein
VTILPSSLPTNIAFKEDLLEEVAPITRREISQTIKHLNLNSASRNDGIGYQIIARFDEASLSISLHLMYTLTTLPEDMQHKLFFYPSTMQSTNYPKQ